MRDIKFRAWDKRDKQMWYRRWFDLNWYSTIDPSENDIEKPIELLDRQHMIIMQYTGIKDKNRVEIYESDIVIWDLGEYEVKFSSFAGGWICKDDKDDFDCPRLYMLNNSSRIEVIGNIHENPELLEK
jgi:uncharacterized phage protein (TIGR01671 family)